MRAEGFDVGVRTELVPDLDSTLSFWLLELDSEDSDIEYFYASRLAGEPAAGVDDIHFHPVEPRSARVTLSLSF